MRRVGALTEIPAGRRDALQRIADLLEQALEIADLAQVGIAAGPHIDLGLTLVEAELQQLAATEPVKRSLP